MDLSEAAQSHNISQKEGLIYRLHLVPALNPLGTLSSPYGTTKSIPALHPQVFNGNRIYGYDLFQLDNFKKASVKPENEGAF